MVEKPVNVATDGMRMVTLSPMTTGAVRCGVVRRSGEGPRAEAAPNEEEPVIPEPPQPELGESRASAREVTTAS